MRSLDAAVLFAVFGLFVWAEFYTGFWIGAHAEQTLNTPGYAAAAGWMFLLLVLLIGAQEDTWYPHLLSSLFTAMAAVAFSSSVGSGTSTHVAEIVLQSSVDAQRARVWTTFISISVMLGFFWMLRPTIWTVLATSICGWAVLSVAWPAIPDSPSSEVLSADFMAFLAVLSVSIPFIAYAVQLPSFIRHGLFMMLMAVALTAGPGTWMIQEIG